MRPITILTTTLALQALAANAQPEETCIPGAQGTVSDCVETSPPVLDNFAQGDFISDDVADPADRGVVAADGSLLTPDEETFAPDDGVNIEVGGILDDGYSELANPGDYGLSVDDQSLYYNVGTSAVRVERDTREILSIDPLSGVDPGAGGDFSDEVGLDAGIDSTIDTGVDTGLGDDPLD